jgi:hypothetical protein
MFIQSVAAITLFIGKLVGLLSKFAAEIGQAVALGGLTQPRIMGAMGIWAQQAVAGSKPLSGGIGAGSNEILINGSYAILLLFDVFGYDLLYFIGSHRAAK